MFFSYSKKADELLTKQVKNSMLGAAACIIAPFVLILLLGNGTKEHQKTMVGIVFLLFAAFAVFEFLRALRCAKVRGNLIKCKMEIFDDKITGMYSENMEVPNSVKFFEIPMCDIRAVDILTFDLGPNKEYATLRIDYQCGSIKLVVDNPEKAASLIKVKI